MTIKVAELNEKFEDFEKRFKDYQDAQQKLRDSDDEWWDKPGGIQEQLVDALSDLLRRTTHLEADNDKLRRMLLGLSDQWADTETTVKINKRGS